MIFPPWQIRLVKLLILIFSIVYLSRFIISSQIIKKIDYNHFEKLWDKTYDMRLERYQDNILRKPNFGPGEKGIAVTLDPAERKIADKQLKNISLNVVASDKMAMDRSLPDNRITELVLHFVVY